jgi:hypothetical protein
LFLTRAAPRGASVLDPAQLVRIEAVHRGFHFQHLYAVQCLLSAAALSVQSVQVESDEDVEVQFEGRRIYVQVKHRKQPLTWNDIEGAITRFGELRAAHERSDRDREPAFLVISNAAPNKGYLRVLTDKARAGEFLVGPMLMALLKTQGRSTAARTG